MMKRWMLLGLMMGLALAGQIHAQPPAEPVHEEVPGVRQPTLRKIHRQKDAAVLDRLEFQRDKLPEQYRRRNNFAWAVAKIKGLEKVEYYDHSGIQNLEDFSTEAASKIADISLRPEQGHYHVLCVNQRDVVDGPDCWHRNVDTEYKILEDMAGRMPDKSVKGRVKLYTDLPPCASCWNVMKQFMAEYTNVQMQVLYRQK